MPTFLNAFKMLSVFLTLASMMTSLVEATPCVAFDSDFNLYALGFEGKDFKLGTQDQWSSSVSPSDITSSGRPPFDGPQTTCYLAQFFNAIYVLDGDKSDSSAIYIYNVAGQSWSKQAVNSGGPNPDALVAILDHDTNEFYALDSGAMYRFDLGEQVNATSSPSSWVPVGNPLFNTTNYKPTMALAENHIHFIGVPNTPAGEAYIFVIHFSFFQSAPQDYQVQGGGASFPSVHGQTTSIFKSQGVQEEFTFIPDDASATYIINVENNSTLPLAAPTDKTESTFVASTSAIVQLTSSGSLFFLPYSPDNADQSKAASWSKINVQGLPSLASGSSSSNSTNTTSPGKSNGSNGTGTTTGSNATGTTGTSGSGKNSALSLTSVMMSTTILPIALLLGSLVTI